MHHLTRATLGICFALAAWLGPSKVALAEAAPAAAWFEMARACETVITDQAFTALAGYAPAPFSVGMPGMKEYAVYDASKGLVTIARVEKGNWVSCIVRESVEGDRTRWRDLAQQWSDGFQAAYPPEQYRWMESVFDPDRPFYGAQRCHGEGQAVLVIPSLRANFAFRVLITSEKPPKGGERCA